MRWTFVIQQKLKVALLLGLIMCLIVLFNLIFQKNISDINRSVNSIYNDRLIPATDIFHLSENLHNRQLAMEKFLFRNANCNELKILLKQYDVKMLDLIAKYEKTYLVDQESVFLKKFKQNVAAYSALENQIIDLSIANKKAEALKLYEDLGSQSLQGTIRRLSDLTTIQSAVGTKLLNDTQGIVATSNFLSNLQLVLAIVIGLMITALIVSSKIINQPQAKFKWN